MKPRPDAHPPLPREDQEFVEWLATSFGPLPPTPAQRVAFDAGLEARLAKHRRRRVLVPALATLASAAVVAWLVWPGRLEPTARRAEQRGPLIAEVSGPAEWEYELFGVGEPSEADQRDDRDFLPDDYVAIASVFLDG